ncbi:cellulase [Mycena rebaudengoi]|nr:cellulase [Mycena rebaudengoi]
MHLSFITLWLSLAVAVLGGPPRRAVPSWAPPLSTRGRYVVDADGNRFKLKSGNWHGGSGTYTGSGDINDDGNHHASENSHTMPLGLQYVPIAQILDSFEQLGINSIRLQWSNEMIHDGNVIQDSWVAANPQFRGLTPLQVYDAVIKALTDRGFAVIINNHTNKSRWCCGVNDGNERWNESQDLETWLRDWVFMVQRYQSNKRVVGADLYNEVRRDILTDPTWGTSDGADWRTASQQAADRILEANQDILIIIEGINWVGIPVDGFAHGRPTLVPVGGLSHTLLVSHKLVYSAHFYGYTGPNHSGATGIGETHDLRYQDFSRDDLFNVIRDTAMYVALNQEMHYTAPVWISEFGVGGRAEGNPVTRTFFQNFVDYLVQTDADFAFWPLVGYLTNGQGNGWALMNWDASGKRTGLFDGDDWRANAWNQLVSSNPASGPRPSVPEWKLLTLEHGDFIQSLSVRRNNGDFDSGASKGVCPDNLRLIGLSHSSKRGLCTDNFFGSLWASDRAVEVVFDERYVRDDWAGGYTKYECPPNYFASGFAVRGQKISTIMCAKASRTLNISNSRTVWFDRGDNRPDFQGGDFAPNEFKGTCGGDEYLAGVAFTTRAFSDGSPAAIVCRRT